MTSKRVYRAVEDVAALGLTKKRFYQVVAGVAGFGLLLMVFALFAGGKAKVTGRVTMMGRPVIWGSVVLVDEKGQSAVGRIESDGTYTVANAPTGDVTVAITSPDPLIQHYATQIKTSRERVPMKQWAPLPIDRSQWFVLPSRYEDAKTSGLSLSLKRGTNTYDLTLQP